MTPTATASPLSDTGLKISTTPQRELLTWRFAREFWSINSNLRCSSTSVGLVYDALTHPEFAVMSSSWYKKHFYLRRGLATCIASRLVTFKTAAISPPKSLDIDHGPCAIATISLYGKEKWRKDADEWKRVGRARIGSFRSRNEADPATFAIVFNSTVDTCLECQCDA